MCVDVMNERVNSVTESGMRISTVFDQDPNRRDPDHEFVSTRRALLLASTLAGVPLAFSETSAFASEIDPSETVITLPDAIHFESWSGAPAHSGEMATLYGGLDKPGPYLVLMKWYPGYMSAPQDFATYQRGSLHDQFVDVQQTRLRR
jgi:hypothetical protein